MQNIIDEITEISLFKSNGQPDGKGRIWESNGKFRWVHPDGSEGQEGTFEAAVKAVETAGV